MSKKLRHSKLLYFAAITFLALVPNTASADSDLPTINAKSAQIAPTPSNPPADLASMTKQITNSVVTIQCGDSIGSGWSVIVDLPNSIKSQGFVSYIITNHHVIEACTDGSELQMLLHNGEVITGHVWAYDSNNDVAGVVTNSYVPGLTWRGQKPMQGWWVGVIGSPLGHPGVLTTGIVSSVSTNGGNLTAPINHGNSGGPVFDSSGRVLGLATAAYTEAQNFGIFNGSPMLCGPVINCPDVSAVWSDKANLPTSGSSLPSKIFLVITLLLVIGGAVFGGVYISKNRKKYEHNSSYPKSTLPTASPFGSSSIPPPPPGR